MNAEQIRAGIDQGTIPCLEVWEPPLTSLDINAIDGRPIIRGLIPMALEAVNCSISTTIDPLITDESGQNIGTLCILARRGDLLLAQLTEGQHAAYLVDAEFGDNRESYQFRHDYFVVDEPKYAAYMSNYYRTASIWGGFLHLTEGEAQNQCFEIDVETIIARAGIRLPTPFNLGSARHAVLCAHSFDRFLRYYHQVELIFDWIVYRQIQNVGYELDGFAKVISRYQSGDLARLKHLVRTYCADIGRLELALLKGAGYSTISQEIFHHFSKDGDPLKDDTRWQRFWTLIDTNRLNLTTAQGENLAHNQAEYAKLLQEVTAYWIYRIRSSIAHNRIGEYILTEDKEEFVVTFGEPVLLECLMQIFSNPDIAGLITPGP